MIKLSENLIALRKHFNVSVEQLSMDTGICQAHIDQYERAPMAVNPMHLLQIADYFNYTIDDLLLRNIEGYVFKASELKCNLLIVDIDGVMTDAGMYYSESGEELKKFNAKDGLAILRYTAAGNQMGVISSGSNRNIIETRCKQLGIQNVMIGTWKKNEVIEQWSKKLNIPLSEMAYIGDDMNDVPIIEKVGLSACPADASKGIKEMVDLVLQTRGGKGCVREFIDEYLFRIE